ncbi:MAG: ROK family protein [Bacteroidales bacterium]
MTNKYYLGVDIGGTNTVYGVVNQTGEIIFQGNFNTKLYNEPIELVKDIFKSFQNFSSKNDIQIKGIGIGAPNGNFNNGCIEFAPNLFWGEMIPIANYFSNIFQLPSKLTNDANAAAIGEKTFGGAKLMNDFIVLTLGTGLGSGIYVNNQIVHGKNGFAGEYGHTKCNESSRQCTCGKIGCIETYVSARGIVQTYQELYFDNYGKMPINEITTKQIYNWALKGDSISRETLNITAKYLGNSLSNLILILDPEAIFLFGGIANAHPLLIPVIEASIHDQVLPILKGKTKILPSQLLNKNAAVLGSAAMWF